MVNEVEVENVNAEPGKEFVFTVENEINDVNLSLMVRLVSEVPKGKPLQEYGKRQIWLNISGQTKRYDFHVVNVTKPILSASWLCEHGVETHLAKKSLLNFGDGHEPLIRKSGVYFVKAQTVNAVGDKTRDRSQERCVRADGSKKSCVQADRLQNSCVQADGLKKIIRTS